MKDVYVSLIFFKKNIYKKIFIIMANNRVSLGEIRRYRKKRSSAIYLFIFYIYEAEEPGREWNGCNEALACAASQEHASVSLPGPTCQILRGPYPSHLSPASDPRDPVLPRSCNKTSICYNIKIKSH